MGLPDHDPEAGLLLEWRLSPHGEWWAYVYWTAEAGGYKGGIWPRETWFHQDSVKQVPGADTTRVPVTYAGPERAPST